MKLTNKLNRCKFAIAAAKLQLQFVSSGDEEQVTISAWKGKDFSLGRVPEVNAFSESLVQTDNLSNSSFQSCGFVKGNNIKLFEMCYKSIS